jgi:UDP-N-acetylglucosamine 4-epimerase
MAHFDKNKISGKAFLVTGGAGFIGSNIVDYLLAHDARLVRALDNLSNGYKENTTHNLNDSRYEFVQGDIRDLETCKRAVDGIEYISHQAALGSVPRSIEDPIVTNSVNISGFLNMLVAAKESSTLVKFVYAASSSTYGDSKELPKVEGNEGKSLSPYAVTKAVNEYYADVFSKNYDFHAIGLRYFNIFGPRQNLNNPYAAVIPIFCKAYLEGTSPSINGDGETSRDFTYVDNAIQANLRALFSDGIIQHEVFNVACGDRTSLNEIIDILKQLSNSSIEPVYCPERKGDVKHSLASIDKITESLGYEPSIRFKEGLTYVYNWYKEITYIE